MNRMIRFHSAVLLLSIGAATLISAGHRISVGPRTGYYAIEHRTYAYDGFNTITSYGNKYNEFIQGLSLGYAYVFDIEDMFCIDIGINNSLDFRFGSYENSDYGNFGRDLFVEPGVGVLFTALHPLAVRVGAGYSYHHTKYTSTGDNVGSNTLALYQVRGGFIISPGLFLQSDVGYIGPVMILRLQTGEHYYANDDVTFDKIEVAARMWDWGFEGGVNRDRLSHTVSIILSKEQFAAREDSDWAVWGKIKPEILFAYKLGISFRGPRLRY
ncbi:MAG: hypothetical protein JW913_20465 [Chitinispirillaceae bacterium]|nr:hypothetical protein [Chitinispirillaceae bacterium]